MSSLAILKRFYVLESNSQNLNHKKLTLKIINQTITIIVMLFLKIYNVNHVQHIDKPSQSQFPCRISAKKT